MPTSLRAIITSDDPAVRDTPLEHACRAFSAADLLAECADLDAFRRSSDSLYHRVRALTFLHAIYRFHLPPKLGQGGGAEGGGTAGHGRISFAGYHHLLERR